MLAEFNTSLSAISQFAVCFANLRACRKIFWAAKVAAKEKTAITYNTDALLYRAHCEGAEARHHALLLGFTSCCARKALCRKTHRDALCACFSRLNVK